MDGIEGDLRDSVRPSDRQAVRELLNATGFFSEGDVAVGVELVEETLKSGLAAGYHYLFLDAPDGSLEGYACFGQVPLTESSWDLYWIAVAPSSKRSGRGRRLLHAVERVAARNGAAQLFVETSGRAQYAPTRSFYEGMGYDKAAEFDDFYAPGESKVVFRRRISDVAD